MLNDYRAAQIGTVADTMTSMAASPRRSAQPSSLSSARLELRRTASCEVIALHKVAANWFADHGDPVEAIRHAQAAADWGMAVRLLADHWFGLHSGEQAATVHAILAGFPAEAHGGMPSSRH
jgi:hypothetical protein